MLNTPSLTYRSIADTSSGSILCGMPESLNTFVGMNGFSFISKGQDLHLEKIYYKSETKWQE